jgi:hypothetical protein
MADSINANGTTLCWNNTPSSTAITRNSSDTVTNNASVTVYYWTGSQPSGGGTQLTARANHTFPQGTSTVTYNFGNSSTSGTQITLTVTGTGKGGGD